MGEPGQPDGASTALASLRELDRERYLASLLMPQKARADLVTLFLFNAEIAAIGERIREPLPGEIRLQWWREAIAGERAGEAAAHPLAFRLLDLMRRRDIPAAPFDAMCEARLFDLYDDPMPDRSTYEGYAGETAAALLQLSAMILDRRAASAAAVASGHAGVAQSVAGHLMLMARHRARGQVFVPGDILAATGLDREAFLAATDKAACGAAICAFAALGREHLRRARGAMGGIASAVMPAFIPVAGVELVYVLAEKQGASCLETPPVPPQWRRQWHYWRSARGGGI